MTSNFFITSFVILILPLNLMGQFISDKKKFKKSYPPFTEYCKQSFSTLEEQSTCLSHQISTAINNLNKPELKSLEQRVHELSVLIDKKGLIKDPIYTDDKSQEVPDELINALKSITNLKIYAGRIEGVKSEMVTDIIIDLDSKELPPPKEDVYYKQENKKWTPKPRVFDEDAIFKVVEEMPIFISETCNEKYTDHNDLSKCGKEALLSFIYDNMQLPQEAIDNNISSMLVAQFIVERDGSVSEIKIVREIGYGCDEEAKRILELFNEGEPKWKAGRQTGTAVRVLWTLPIKFRL